jgi:hypothetical protein
VGSSFEFKQLFCSHYRQVNNVLFGGVIYFRATYIFVYDVCEIWICKEELCVCVCACVRAC